MAALTRPTEASYTINERVTVNTSDREDHTFCGIMFPVQCKTLLPIERLVISSISVRGKLGPLTVWVSNTTDSPELSVDKTKWTKIFSKTLQPSFSEYRKLDVSHSPIILRPGEVRGVYVHSTLHSDQAIVYDNYRGRTSSRYTRGFMPGIRILEGVFPPDEDGDDFLTINQGYAHVSPIPFGNVSIWGSGFAWRQGRRFVGKVDYGVVYKLWNPKEHLVFGNSFHKLVVTMFMCQRRWESPMSRLPDECIFYILNMCKWDWAACEDVSKKRNTDRTMAKSNDKKETTTSSSMNTPTANSEDTEDTLGGEMIAATTAATTTTTTTQSSNALAACCALIPRMRFGRVV